MNFTFCFVIIIEMHSFKNDHSFRLSLIKGVFTKNEMTLGVFNT